MSFKAKIYTTNEQILEEAAKDCNVKLDFLGKGVGKGYALSEDTLRVFTEGSCVDLDPNTPDITDRYVVVKTKGGFLL